MTPRPRPQPIATPAASPSARSWLLLVHQLPPTPSNLRVRTWRRLQQLGALPVKQAVYVLPDRPEAREDFEWLKAEIEGSGGEAAVFSADPLDPATDAALVDTFRKAAQAAYVELTADLQRAIRTDTRPAAARGRSARQTTERLKERMAAIERLDFFGAPGRERVVSLLAGLGRRGDEPDGQRAGQINPKSRPYTNRLWVTRPRPGVDRMSSAWLIRRFIDPRARFGFVTDAKAAPAQAVPFDMFGVELSHHGDHCTFETLSERFAIRDPAVARLAEIVHDLDLKDGKFGAAEAATVAALIDGLQRTVADDQVLLDRGMTMFESLYQSFSRVKESKGSSRRRTRGTRS
jgi:hypothetical protein